MVVLENGLRAVNIFGHSSKSLWYCEHVTICFERVCPYQRRVAVVEKKFFYFWMYWKFLVGEFVV
ncbi:hypothetical protein RchiOBHm_Chr1g0339011 [Rosa chinensis]|uniref:Uncharacterized protein n=1 Tax=Rosa chinensis TaxID=74649 RepID=A0A2P6SD53_ROSCH|nr:hypothetical protein RchiOBHm_Chr1g0339011 [Rosa chinensis]